MDWLHLGRCLCIANNAMGFLVRNAYALTLAWVFVEQLGAPVPAAPVLLAGGALARTGEVQIGAIVLLGAFASLLAHLAWYEAGKRSGHKILKSLCRVSLEPDACVRRTENLFGRHGPKTLLVSNFIPGLGLIAQPLAAMAGVSRPRFFALNIVGSLLWAGTWVAAGYAVGPEIEKISSRVPGLGAMLPALIVVALGVYLIGKLRQRRRVLQDLRMARITAGELKQKLDGGEPIVVVDLRHRSEVDREPEGIPGALRILPEEMELRHVEIPRGQEVVLYCT
jgi:membrane protein DedA with SNARE-associated domain